METTISFKLDDPEVVVQIIRVLAGDTSKPRKPRKPLTEAEKKALVKRLADGRTRAAAAREESAKAKPSTRKTTRKTTTRKAPATKK